MEFVVPKSKVIEAYLDDPRKIINFCTEKFKSVLLEFVWGDLLSCYRAFVLISKRKPLLAYAKLHNTFTLKGHEVLDLIYNVPVVLCVAYEVDRKHVKYLQSLYRNYAVAERETTVVQSINDFLRENSDISGVIIGTGNNYYAKVYVDEGSVVGAYVKLDDREYYGGSALFFLNIPCAVSVLKSDLTQVPPEMKVAMSTDELYDKIVQMAKSDEKLQRILNILS